MTAIGGDTLFGNDASYFDEDDDFEYEDDDDDEDNDDPKLLVDGRDEAP